MVKCNQCGGEAKLGKTEKVQDKFGKVIATIHHFICENQHVFQR